MTISPQFASLYGGQEVIVWSDCLLDLGTDFLVGDMVFVRVMQILRLYVYQEKEFLQRFIFLAVDLFHAFVVTFKSTFTYHLTARVVGHH